MKNALQKNKTGHLLRVHEVHFVEGRGKKRRGEKRKKNNNI